MQAITFLVLLYLVCAAADIFMFNETLKPSNAHSLSKQASKKMFSNSTRLLFIAGLEGTGHHAFKAMFETCLRGSNNNTGGYYCESASRLSLLLQNFTRPFKADGLFSTEDHYRTSELIDNIQTRMTQLAQRSGEHIYFLG